MIWNIFEYAATFVEYMIYADFMLKFLKPKKKQMALLCYLLILGINTALTLTFNHFISYEGILGGLRIIINFLIIIRLFLFKMAKKYRKQSGSSPFAKKYWPAGACFLANPPAKILFNF